MIKNNRRALDLLKKFNVIVDECTEEAVLSGMITVKDVLNAYGKSCCDWVVIDKPPTDYTLEEREFFDKYLYGILEIGKERNVVIDFVEDKDEITVQIKHRDSWFDFQREIGFIDNWYSVYLSMKRLLPKDNDEEDDDRYEYYEEDDEDEEE